MSNSSPFVHTIPVRYQDCDAYGIVNGVNYYARIDDPQKVARALGVDSSISATEKQWIGASVVASLATILTVFF